MVKEATSCGGRKCSHCGHNGHNSRTCNGKGCVKLFGVYVSENSRASMKKSSSVENMRSPSCNKSSELAGVDPPGYLSDDPNHRSQEAEAARERKRGKPWTMEEHVTFLEGLKKLGKGDWRGISKNFVPTRTPTQVASHAQKYFLRQVINDKKKRRTSMFDLHSQDHDHDDASPDSPVTRPNVVTEATTSHSQAFTSSKSLDVAAQRQNALQVVEQFPALCLDNPSVGPCPVGIRMIQPNFPPPDWSFPLSSYYPMGNFRSLAPGSFHTYLNPQVHHPYIPLPLNVTSQARIDLPMSSPRLRDPTELQLGGPQSPKEANRQSSKSVASIQFVLFNGLYQCYKLPYFFILFTLKRVETTTTVRS
ncbi:uncharacterized protein J3R85_018170 [Psidium guajava]|nr:uncharacterized protein J3R85_018170 [Psidium guajava]